MISIRQLGKCSLVLYEECDVTQNIAEKYITQKPLLAIRRARRPKLQKDGRNSDIRRNLIDKTRAFPRQAQEAGLAAGTVSARPKI